MNPTINDAYLDSVKKGLSLKVLEFLELGYNSVTVDDLSYYVTEYLWKHQVPENETERMNQIMQIKPNDYWDFILLEVQVAKVKPLDQIDICELF
ncbi:Post-transcriptional regulator [Granulicatella balaenopterae]|uniref:Post-transcriptional regulator n=1 Tax=Granulicatella balaenopterae TaxID=137733 RepID=A0A1H9MW04_9LACT|nr:post-transcriptional regulator [Granulicatella balaenopterae]SER27890.1 Post-transcriptional regulator [Granulicatella balaenopterae]